MYKKNCKRCGNDFISRSTKARYCPECVPVIKLRSLKSKNKELNRACTDDTEFLVSIYNLLPVTNENRAEFKEVIITNY